MEKVGRSLGIKKISERRRIVHREGLLLPAGVCYNFETETVDFWTSRINGGKEHLWPING